MKSSPLKSPRLEQPAFAELDRHFGQFIGRFGGGELVALAAAHLSRAVRLGHICLDLASAPRMESGEPFPWFPLSEWQDALAASRAVATPSDPNPTPLVLDAAGRLYLRRYFNYERALANALRLRAGAIPAPGGEGQDAAIEAALANPLTVISGGPGTGKTTTAVQILSRLLRGQNSPTRLALAAPTGKAAARLEQTIRDGLTQIGATELLPLIPRASTLHRLLGSRGNLPDFRHHAGNPLALDLLIVDEASMVPLPLMAKCFDALLPAARVVLLGDRDQLASVDPGNVLAEIVDAAACPGSPMEGSLVTLKTNFRFGNDSGIQRLCGAVREGRSVDALGFLQASANDLASAPLPAPAALGDALREPVLAGYGPFLRERDPARALDVFGRFRILCAVRLGPYGVEEMNRRIEAILREARLIAGPHEFFAGLPLLITRNEPQLGLFNGDIGILLPDPAEADTPAAPLWAWFPGDHINPTPRRIPPAQLPAHEPAFAMTVHKSQGSEFGEVLLVLPDRDSPVLSRELIYTGLTRARQRVTLWAEASVFERGVARRTERASGLREALTATA